MIRRLKVVTEGVRLQRSLKRSLFSDRNYISKTLFTLWWKVGDRLRFMSESYVEKVIQLNPIKQKMKESLRRYNDTYSSDRSN